MVEPVGIALVGLGNWSRHLAAAIRRAEGTRLVACYTRTPEKRQAFAADFGCADAPTLDNALSAPGVEAAVLATPADSHAALTFISAARRLHVLVEKPMALSVEEARHMAQACQDAGVVLMVNHEMRRLGSTRAMKHLVESGELGRIITATANMTLTGRFHPDNWRCHRDTNRGGALMQLGIHQIENLRYLLGEVMSVRGVFANAVAPNDVDDVGVAHLEFASGARAVVSSSYVSPSAYDLVLFGDRANLRCVADMRVWPDSLQVDPHTSLTLHTRTELEDVPREPQDVLAQQMNDFARAIRAGGEPETGWREGLAAVAIVEAALQSFASGEPVDPRPLMALEQDVTRGGDNR